MTSIRRVFRVFDIKPKIVESEHPVTTPPHAGTVVYKNVRFHYGQDCDENRIRLDEDEPERFAVPHQARRPLPHRRRPALGAGWRHPGDRRRRARGPGRPFRVRQDDPGVAAAPPVRHRLRPDHHRRHRHPRLLAQGAAAGDRRRPAGLVPVQRHHPREPDLRPARRHRGTDRRRRPGGQRPRVHLRPARRLRHHARRARRQPLRRPAAAPVHRPGHPQGPAHPDPRRGHQRLGRRERNPGAAGPEPADAGPDLPDHRPPPQHRPQRPPHPGPAGRQDRRGRRPRRADRARRALRPPRPAPVRAAPARHGPRPRRGRPNVPPPTASASGPPRPPAASRNAGASGPSSRVVLSPPTPPFDLRRRAARERSANHAGRCRRPEMSTLGNGVHRSKALPTADNHW